jgi:hypothetical protein
MNAVVTIAHGEFYQKLKEITHPSIKAYADKIGAEFIVIDRKQISETTIHWEKFQIFNLLNKYERIIFIDTDIIIREDCPNLFDVVPADRLGAFNEAPFTLRSYEMMLDICKKYEKQLPKWDGRYFNTGVMVISRHHKSIFKKPEKEIFSFYEQSYLNMMIALENTSIIMYELPHHYNRMVCMDKFTGEERHASYMIHYAGYPFFDPDLMLRLIPMDLEKWKQDKGNYNYRRHIYIGVTGGYGDQINAEPAVRKMVDMYKGDEIIIATHWPRLFAHLQSDDVQICNHGQAKMGNDTPYFIAESLPGPSTAQWAICSHLLCHSVDYTSIALMKRTLPISERQPHFFVGLQDYSNLFDIIGIREDLKDFVVVHPGRHWNSKTFPKSFWQDIVNGLVNKGEKVIIVGKDDPGDAPLYINGARGTVDIDVPEGVIDLRNLLDVGSFGALLSEAKCLISNDSFPIHLAGCFNNKIILIPSCKHPDHVLPYRQGQLYFNAHALYKKLTIDAVESKPTQVYQTSAEMEDINWSEYLPEVKDLLEII